MLVTNDRAKNQNLQWFDKILITIFTLTGIVSFIMVFIWEENSCLNKAKIDQEPRLPQPIGSG